MQRKFLVEMVFGLMAGTLLADLTMAYAGQEPWSWSSVLASLAGVATGVLVLWRFWTPPLPSDPTHGRRTRRFALSLMLLAFVVFILTIVTQQTSVFFFALPGLLFLIAAIIGFMSQDRASRAALLWPFVIGIGMLATLLLVAVVARLYPR